jgi:hypothetical protein
VSGGSETSAHTPEIFASENDQLLLETHMCQRLYPPYRQSGCKVILLSIKPKLSKLRRLCRISLILKEMPIPHLSSLGTKGRGFESSAPTIRISSLPLLLTDR